MLETSKSIILVGITKSYHLSTLAVHLKIFACVSYNSPQGWDYKNDITSANMLCGTFTQPEILKYFVTPQKLAIYNKNIFIMSRHGFGTVTDLQSTKQYSKYNFTPHGQNDQQFQATLYT